MPIHYLDLENGADYQDGSDWANAWKTIKAGPTAARTASGDEIRIAKTPDPSFVTTATIDNNARVTFTLASGCTLDITDCDSVANWTASANVSISAYSTYKMQGSYSMKIVPASAFTTGLVAYYALPSALDISEYYALNLWFLSTDSTPNSISVALCSGATGDGIIYDWHVPTTVASYNWNALVFDNNGQALASGTAIKSLAIYASIDPSSYSHYFDNIFLSKHEDDPKCIDLNSMLALSSGSVTAEDTTFWGAIANIYQNQVGYIMGGINNNWSYTKSLHPFMEDTTVNVYRRRSFRYGNYGSRTTYYEEVQETGLTFAGGYNTSSNLQDGMTSIISDGCIGYYLDTDTRSGIVLDHLIIGRFYRGVFFDSSSKSSTVKNCSFTGAMYPIALDNYHGIHLENVGINLCYSVLDINSNIEARRTNTSSIKGNCNFFNCVQGCTYPIFAQMAVFSGEIRYGDVDGAFPIMPVNPIEIYGLSIEGSSSNGGLLSPVATRFKNCSFEDPTNAAYSLLRILPNDSIFEDCDFGDISLVDPIFYTDVVNYAQCYCKNCTGWKTDTGIELVPSGTIVGCNHRIFPQVDTRHTASGFALRVAIANFITETTAMMPVSDPLPIEIAEVAVSANSEVTVSCYVKKEHASNLQTKLICPGGQISGVVADVEDEDTDTTDWQQLSIKFTPTDQGVVKIYVYLWVTASISTNDQSIYIDDLVISQS